MWSDWDTRPWYKDVERFHVAYNDALNAAFIHWQHERAAMLAFARALENIGPAAADVLQSAEGEYNGWWQRWADKAPSSLHLLLLILLPLLLPLPLPLLFPPLHL